MTTTQHIMARLRAAFRDYLHSKNRAARAARRETADRHFLQTMNVVRAAMSGKLVPK